MTEAEMKQLNQIKAQLEQLGYKNVVIEWSESGTQLGISIHAEKTKT